MKRPVIVLLACLMLGTGCHPSGQQVGLYLQLVRGTDQDAPPEPQALPAGPTLDERLHSVFKWKYYWEIKRDAIALREGQHARRRMSPDREVEVELLNPQRMAVRIYEQGNLIRSRRQPVESAFCVAGGSRGEDQSWFIVVRRDRPIDVVER